MPKPKLLSPKQILQAISSWITTAIEQASRGTRHGNSTTLIFRAEQALAGIPQGVVDTREVQTALGEADQQLREGHNAEATSRLSAARKALAKLMKRL